MERALSILMIPLSLTLALNYSALVFSVSNTSFQSTFDRIAAQLQRPVDVTLASDDSIFYSSLAARNVSLYLVNPVLRTCLEYESAFSILGTAQVNGSNFYGGLILSRTPLQASDLKSLRISGVQYPALAGFILQYRSLLQMGVNLLISSKVVLHTTVGQVLADIQSGAADVALVPTGSVPSPNSLGLQPQFARFDPLLGGMTSTALVPELSMLAPLPGVGVSPNAVAEVLDLYNSTWQPPLSVLGVTAALQALNIATNGSCIRSDQFYQALQCPNGLRKASYAHSVQSCARTADACGSDLCLCDVCQAIPVDHTTLIVALAVAIPIVLATAGAAVCYDRIRRRREASEGYAFAILSTQATKAFGAASRPKIESVLGSGAYGTVYAGIWMTLRVAFKICPATETIDEALLGISLHHENVVQTYAYAVVRHQSINAKSRPSLGGWPQHSHTPPGSTIQTGASERANVPRELWIVLERCDCSLWDAVERGDFGHPNKWAKVQSAMRQIALGIEYVHQAHHIHGDLNCNNVLVKDGVMKVADLGIAKNVAKWTKTSKDTNAFGTVTHMAPELMRTGRASFRVDTFAFGVLSWEVAHGRHAHDGVPPATIMHQVISGERLTFDTDVPDHLRKVIERCTEPEPEARPAWGWVRAQLGLN